MCWVRCPPRLLFFVLCTFNLSPFCPSTCIPFSTVGFFFVVIQSASPSLRRWCGSQALGVGEQQAESGAEQPVRPQRSGAPSVFGVTFYSPCAGPHPAYTCCSRHSTSRAAAQHASFSSLLCNQ